MQGSLYDRFGTTPGHIRARMRDPRFAFFLKPDAEALAHDPFTEVLGEWLGFSGVPTETADLAIGVVLQLLFELCLRSNRKGGVGRHRPVLVVITGARIVRVPGCDPEGARWIRGFRNVSSDLHEWRSATVRPF